LEQKIWCSDQQKRLQFQETDKFLSEIEQRLLINFKMTVGGEGEKLMDVKESQKLHLQGVNKMHSILQNLVQRSTK
jgi:hypothetical protein